MDTRRVLLVDAFTDEPLAGNAAGVVPEADGLAPEQMQAIARELAVSETAFVTADEGADRRLHFYSPTSEVDLCGHATVATHALLHETGVIEPGVHEMATNVGTLPVEIEADGTVWMTQDEPAIREVVIEAGRLASALGIDEAAITEVADDLPLAVASTGVPFLVVPVAFLEHVGNAAPEMDAVETLCAEVDATGIYLFSFDALEAGSTLHGRAFAPALGIPEDPVTGTASGAVGAYLDEVEAFEETPELMVFEQGHYVDRPGTVSVRIGDRVEVGGSAVVALEGELSVPPASDEDILEV